MSYSFVTEEEDENIKYLKGEKAINIKRIEQLTLVIAFDYISVQKTEFCFNNENIVASDYAKLFEFKKDISKIKIIDFYDNENISRKYHFHQIDLFKKKFLIDKIKILLGYGNFVEVAKLPTIYQMAGYTNEKKAPRILGFFGRNATFHILWLDYEHKIYTMNINSKNSNIR